MKQLTEDFYLNDDVVDVSKRLLGKILVTQINGELTSGRIVETEAYGVNDRASHAFGGRRTSRTETMYAKGGTAYIYLCYGIHHLFNVITNQKDVPEAVLIRGIEPLDGIETMMQRRGHEKLKSNLTAGPGILSQALGITRDLDGHSLYGPEISIYDDGTKVQNRLIVSGTRVGIDYAGGDAKLPWRFWIKGTKWKSPAA